MVYSVFIFYLESQPSGFKRLQKILCGVFLLHAVCLDQDKKIRLDGVHGEQVRHMLVADETDHIFHRLWSPCLFTVEGVVESGTTNAYPSGGWTPKIFNRVDWPIIREESSSDFTVP